MSNVFREFFHKENIDFRNLSSDTLIIFDTNTLLNIYRYSDTTKSKLISVITDISNNIWIPYQVGLEFNLNRHSVIYNMKQNKKVAHDEICDAFNTFKNKIDDILNKTLSLKSSDTKEIKQKIKDDTFNDLNQINEKISDDLTELFSLTNLDDDLANTIMNLFKDKIGSSYDNEKLMEKLSDAEYRYENKIPPGYKDINKKGKRFFNGLEMELKYGDLILWHQILDRSKDTNINKIVFITDDVKEDWWYLHKGKNLGPRAELKNEMLRLTNTDFYMYQTNDFLNNSLNSSENLIEEFEFEFEFENENDDFEDDPFELEDFLTDSIKKSEFDKKISKLESKKEQLEEEISDTYKHIEIFRDLGMNVEREEELLEHLHQEKHSLIKQILIESYRNKNDI